MEGAPGIRLDTVALDGLRGIAAFHVMVGHLLSSFINIQLNVVMPVFYLLSGFTLALSYGTTEEEHQPVVTKIRKSVKFYQNRIPLPGK